MLKWIGRFLRRRRPDISALCTVAAEAEHPYAAEIAAFRGRKNSILMINCRAIGCTFNGHPIPDGEFGPQCDTIPEDVIPLAMDDRYVYCDDGERYPWRPARP